MKVKTGMLGIVVAFVNPETQADCWKMDLFVESAVGHVVALVVAVEVLAPESVGLADIFVAFDVDVEFVAPVKYLGDLKSSPLRAIVESLALVDVVAFVAVT